MPNLEPDFKEMLSALCSAGADFLLIGGHALGFHGLPRYTHDIDFWVRPTAENAQRVWKAMEAFGAPMFMFEPSDLTKPDMVLQIGVAPLRIDIITSIVGVDFETAWKNRVTVKHEGIEVPVIGIDELIQNKLASGREEDKLDAKKLEKLRSSRNP